MATNFFGLTDAGRQRSNNEDTFIAETLRNGRYIAACVIDGVGGYEGGEVAAEIARETILDQLKRIDNSGNIAVSLKDAVAAANKQIYQQKIENRRNGQMACVVTLALADIEENKFYYAHVGDTRLYLLRDQSLVKVTKDHSFVGFLEDSGRLSEEAAMKHPKRNEINKALGFDDIAGNAEYIETGDSPFLPGDILLLCSDGLTDMVSNSGLRDVLVSGKTIEKKAETLISAANNAGGKDNITVVLVWNDKEPVKQEATKPAVSLRQDNHVKSEGVALSAKENHDDIRRPEVKKKANPTVSILSILLVLVVAALAWLLYRDYVKDQNHRQEVQSRVEVKQRSEQEQAFVDNIDATTNGEVFLVTTAPGQQLVITDSILIHKDSLHIIGNGMTLVADTSYKGPAFIVAANTRYFLLDSITLQGFDVGVLMRSPGLHLQNVQFKNCKVPVEYQMMFPANAVVNGRLTDSAFLYIGNTQNNY
ncbi:PP2C family protein-serine/threonine phosphatase [Aridibaculum aurantiacum]|uniref:PP2C family protein-serine/threonine phosphatase n=1 Tax=Aridibaculum aurantiacum TaxID=2810307 RepID=UPI001A960029|nr:protein phosphatase 2C domain-containing protein [Aridibaculum aurantiacum]